MPAEHQHAGPGTLPAWRQSLKNAIGEDPARYLDRPLLDTDPNQSDDMLESRIRGIRRIEVIGAWKAAERRLDRGPRDRILDLLDKQKSWLDDQGERPRDLRATLEDDPENVPDRYWPSRGQLPADEQSDGDSSDEKRYPPIRERFSERAAGLVTASDGSVLSDARTSETTEQAGLDGYAPTSDDVATDGGEETDQ